jgi:hypothetical protein
MDNSYCTIKEAYHTPLDIENKARLEYNKNNQNYADFNNAFKPSSETQYYQSEDNDSLSIDDDTYQTETATKPIKKNKHNFSLNHLENCKKCRIKVRKILKIDKSHKNKSNLSDLGNYLSITGDDIKETVVMILVAFFIFKIIDKAF